MNRRAHPQGLPHDLKHYRAQWQLIESDTAIAVFCAIVLAAWFLLDVLKVQL